MRAGHLARVAQEGVAVAEVALDAGDGVAAVDRVQLHLLEFRVGQLARLEQDGVRDAHLADVAQRRGLAQQRDIVVAEFIGEAALRLQVAGQHAHVQLDAADMVGGLVVARLGQRGQRPDRRVDHLRQLVGALGHEVLDQLVLVAQQVARLLQQQMRAHPRQQRLGHQRLGQHVGRTGAEAALLVQRQLVPGQKDDGDAGRVGIGLELPADVVAVDLGQVDIEQHDVGTRQLLRQAQRATAVVGQLGFVLVLQQAVHRHQVIGRRVDDQDDGLRLDIHGLLLPGRRVRDAIYENYGSNYSFVSDCVWLGARYMRRRRLLHGDTRPTRRRSPMLAWPAPGVRPAIRHTTSHKDSIMAQLEKVLYTGKTHTTGGRDGKSRSSDGRLDIALSAPGGMGAGTNPEQLFAAGWSACFIGAMSLAASKMKVALPADVAVDAEVDLGMIGDGYFLQARLDISLPGLPREVAEALVGTAHQTCPYSKLTHGNINVTINLA